MTDGMNPLAEVAITEEVIEVTTTGPVRAVTPAKKPAARSMPKWETRPGIASGLPSGVSPSP
jgi:hypothetical protein